MGNGSGAGGSGNKLGIGGKGKGGSGNGIGDGAGAPGGKKGKTQAAGPYIDPGTEKAPGDVLKRGNEAAATNDVRDEKFLRLYAPDGRMPNTRVTGKRGEKGKETVSFVKGAPDKASSSVPYYDVYERYAPAAENALNREDIPSNYKKQVRDYFDALRPSSNSAGGQGKGAGGR